ncbi:MAG: dihydrolipoamide acetyltransferase family protein [Chloroflexota bacterium]
MAKEIVMPSLGMFTAEGTLSAWLRTQGARVEAGEPVAEVTTEKTAQELVAPVAGIIHQVATVGASLPIQGLIGYILAEGERPPMTLANAPATPAVSSAAPPPSTAPRPGPAGEIRASPIARRLAAEHRIDLSQVVGSGPDGRIVEADVLVAVARRGAADGPAPSPAPSVAQRRIRERIPLTGVRRTIAERLRSSLATGAPVTLTREVDAEALVAARGQLGERLGAPIPYDALFVKLLATALRERPALNATIENDEIIVLDDIHVGFAVALPSGLIVPVVRDADRRSLAEIAATVRDLSGQARASHLTADDVSGGTVTITNLGASGVDGFTPIINPPQSAILGVGRILARPVVRDGGLVVGQTCVLSLTFDHRVVDGVPAAQLLDGVAKLMNDREFLEGLG